MSSYHAGRSKELSEEVFQAWRAELRAFRRVKQLTQRAAAVWIGAHEYTWARWERGLRRPPVYVVEGVRALMQRALESERKRQLGARRNRAWRARQEAKTSDRENQR